MSQPPWRNVFSTGTELQALWVYYRGILRWQRFEFMAKVLLIDDDQVLLNQVREWLTLVDGISVDTAPSGSDAMAHVERDTYDLIVSDWELPDTSGIDLIRIFRDQGLLLPILMLTGKSAVKDKTQGFNAGADAYLTKPESAIRLLGVGPFEVPQGGGSDQQAQAFQYRRDIRLRRGRKQDAILHNGISRRARPLVVM